MATKAGSSFLDRAIAAVAPRYALARTQARHELSRYDVKPTSDVQRRQRQQLFEHMLSIARGFDGAKNDRMLKNWQGNAGQSIDLQLLRDGRMLKQRARDLVQNNGFAKGAQNAIVANVVGTGIKPMRPEWIKQWEHWCQYEADISGHQHFYEMQPLALKECMKTGEVLVKKVWFTPAEMRRLGRRSPFGLQLIESERLAEESQTFGVKQKNPKTGNDIRNGVEIDSYGRPVAYYVLPTHPSDLFTEPVEPEPIPAKFIRHCFVREEIGQTRGFSWYAAAINWLFKLGLYADNEMTASALTACLMLWFETAGDGDTPTLLAPDGEETTDDDGNSIDEFRPAMVGRGTDKPHLLNPTRPNAQADPWITLMLRSIGVSMDLGYEAISRDHSKTNFSGQRGEELENRRRYRQVSCFLKWQFLDPIFVDWVRGNVLAGVEGFPSIDQFIAEYDTYADTEWISDAREWVDPTKEGTAEEDALKTGRKTFKRYYAEQGIMDWKAEFAQQAEERAERKRLGLPQIEEVDKPPPKPDQPQSKAAA